MSKTVPVKQAVTTDEQVLPVRIQEMLGEMVGAAREGLMALSVGVGLAVLGELMDEEVEQVVGPKGKHNPDRSAGRHGYEEGEVTLGGRRVAVKRPRARSSNGQAEVPLETYKHFSDRDPLTKVILERMLSGVSTRSYQRTGEPVGRSVEANTRSTSSSSVSRAFVERTKQALKELMSRRLDDVRLAVLMVDGIELKGRTNIVALGITTEGVKIPLGLWEGSTENASVVTALLAHLVERGLDISQGVLVVLDGAKALHKAVRDVLGPVPVQRCIRHKERNVLDHLPENQRPVIKQRLRSAWALDSHDAALKQLQLLAGELEHAHPGACASLREGMEQTLTVNRLGISGKLKTTLSSTNPIESMISVVRTTSRNVKNWQSGDMTMRWTAAGMLEAEKKFKRIMGYRDLAKLAVAVERDLATSIGSTNYLSGEAPTEESGHRKEVATVPAI